MIMNVTIHYEIPLVKLAYPTPTQVKVVCFLVNISISSCLEYLVGKLEQITTMP